MNPESHILSALSLSGLYAITDNANVEPVLRGGCKIIQYRNKNSHATERRREAGLLRELCHRYQAILIINDDIDLAQQIQADGAHIGQTDISIVDAQRQLGSKMIIGVSCHNSLDLAVQAQQQGASYVAFGRFFESSSKPDAPPADIRILQRAKQQLRIPIVAIGGITRDNASRVIEAGADMVAVINDLFAVKDADELERRSRIFTQLFSNCTDQKI